MINTSLYLTNYAYGQIVQFQIEQYLKNHDFAQEVDHIYRLGRLTPDEWMKQAVGSEVSPEPLIEETKKVLKLYGK